MDYILISYYNPGRPDNKWEVYGHRSLGDNDSLGDFDTEEEAREKASRYGHYGIPMIQGGHGATDAFFNRLEDVVEKKLSFRKKVEKIKETEDPDFDSWFDASFEGLVNEKGTIRIIGLNIADDVQVMDEKGEQHLIPAQTFLDGDYSDAMKEKVLEMRQDLIDKSATSTKDYEKWKKRCWRPSE